MEVLSELPVKVFLAGSCGDPCPAGDPRERRVARCVTDNTIVFFSTVLHRWVDDSGKFHTGHRLELPQ
jgi:hypothetical protein